METAGKQPPVPGCDKIALATSSFEIGDVAIEQSWAWHPIDLPHTFPEASVDDPVRTFCILSHSGGHLTNNAA